MIAGGLKKNGQYITSADCVKSKPATCQDSREAANAIESRDAPGVSHDDACYSVGNERKIIEIKRKITEKMINSSSKFPRMSTGDKRRLEIFRDFTLFDSKIFVVDLTRKFISVYIKRYH